MCLHPRSSTVPWFSLLLLLARPAVSDSQRREPAPQEVEDSLQRVARGEFNPRDVELLATSGAGQAIPALKKQFAVTGDTQLKGFIASALVRLGSKEEGYWQFLLEYALKALENDAPPIFLTDASGRIMRGHGKFSPAFEAWAKAKGLDPNLAAQAQLYEYPLYFGHLAKTGDPRGRSVLRRGLVSQNYTIQALSAKGLAKMADSDAIPLIIEACRRTHKEVAPLIARALVFFDDPRAQKAAEEFIHDKSFLQEMRRRAQQQGADPFMF